MLPGMLTDSSDALYSTCVRTYVYVRHVCAFVCLGIYMSGGVGDGEECIHVAHALDGEEWIGAAHAPRQEAPREQLEALHPCTLVDRQCIDAP